MKSFYFIAIVLIVFSLSGSGAYAEEDNPCIVCHVDFKKPAAGVHAPLSSGCQACHMPVEDKKHPEQTDSMKLIRDVPELCYDCHDRSQFKGKSVHPPVVMNTCTSCHNPHLSNFKRLLVKDMPGLCFECHNGSNFKDKSVHQPVGKGMCTSCHAPHASNFSKILISDPPELCYRCHDRKPFTKKYVHVAAAIPNGCSLCHNHHAGSNQKLLLQPALELCTSCHSTQKNGMHILGSMNLGIGETIHPVKGVQDPSSPPKELTCTSCHNPHSSDFAKLFLQKYLCKRCHKEFSSLISSRVKES
jgi:predicted CXXCH cytochrome family protein